jgi:two-component system NtrC family sensor kinase
LNDSKEINILEERLKELSCLYEVSSLISNRNLDFSQKIESSVQSITKAWWYPGDAVCILRIDDNYWSSKTVEEETICQAQLIQIDGVSIGSLTVHYPSQKHSKSDFLPEEYTLLGKLAYEIANLLDKKIRQEREEEFLKTFQRQDRLNILGEIAAGIAHELNTPLGNILGFSQFIMESNSSLQVKEDAKKIMNSVLHAREVVKNLMFFSCELPQQIESIDIVKSIHECIALISPTLRDKTCDIQFTSTEKELFANIDHVQFTQILFNLINNAHYASKKGDAISIHLSKGKHSFFLQVSDVGKGIPTSIQERIFEPFYTTKPTNKGTGLGLSVVHGIVKAHKGHIHVTSEENVGTTFSIEIPFKNEI